MATPVLPAMANPLQAAMFHMMAQMLGKGAGGMPPPMPPEAMPAGVPQPPMPPQGPINEVTGGERHQNYKTMPCKYYLEGRCFQGKACNFLHTDVDGEALPQLEKPTNYKTEIC